MIKIIESFKHLKMWHKGTILGVIITFLALPATAYSAPNSPETSIFTLSASALQLAANPKPLRQFAQKNVSLREAKSIAQKKYPQAKVIDIFPKGDGYRVRLQSKAGRVFDVFIDAATGRVKS